MKKFRVSKSVFKLSLLGLTYPLAGGGIFAGVIISNLRSSPIDIETIRLALFVLIVSLLTMVLAVYEMLWDFPGGGEADGHRGGPHDVVPGPFFELLRYVPPEWQERLWQNVG